MDDDWIASFFEKAKIVSNEAMQGIWARILAGEANSPGTYSKRTLSLLADFDKADAELFSTLCRFCVEGVGLVPMVFESKDSIYSDIGLNFGSLQHLESLGLIQFNSFTAFNMNGMPQYFALRYAEHKVDLALKALDDGFSIGQVLFTKMGAELASLVDRPEVPGFVDYLVKHFEELGNQAACAPRDLEFGRHSPPCRLRCRIGDLGRRERRQLKVEAPNVRGARQLISKPCSVVALRCPYELPAAKGWEFRGWEKPLTLNGQAMAGFIVRTVLPESNVEASARDAWRSKICRVLVSPVAASYTCH